MEEEEEESVEVLTLEGIMDDSQELEYITKMRNWVEFRIFDGLDYQRVSEGFQHHFLVKAEEREKFHRCMIHALSCHKDPLLVVSSSEEPQNIQTREGGHFGNTPKLNFTSYRQSRYYCTGSNRITYPLVIDVRAEEVEDSSTDEIVDEDENLDAYLPHTWRRTYFPFKSMFLCDLETTDLFLRVQRQSTPKRIDVLKQITNRAIQGPLNQHALLERMASPYYYLFPHQREGKYYDIRRGAPQDTNQTVEGFDSVTFRTFLLREGRF